MPGKPVNKPIGKPIPIRKTALALAAATLLTLNAGNTQAAGITTVQIMAQTISALPSCLNYQVTGVCFFLRCYLFYCTINTSIKVKHYMPDDVVSTFSSPDQHPWIDVGALFAGVTQAPGNAMLGGVSDAQADTYAQTPSRENIMTFKNASAIGNPVEALIGGNMTPGFPDFSELSSFPSSELSRIGQLWAQTPSQLASQTLGNVNSMLGQIQNLPAQFSSTLSKLGSSTSSLSSAFSNVADTSRLSDTFGGIYNNLSAGNFTGLLSNFGSLGQLSSQGMSALNQLGSVSSMKDSFTQISSAIGGQVGGANGVNVQGMSGSQTMSALSKFICPGGSGLFTMNFDSSLDSLFWRGVIPLEQLYPSSWIPGVGEVGNGLVNTWGNLYPRIGELPQPHPVKASAVIAARVASIIEQKAQPHIYKRLTGQGDYQYFTVAANPKWQMLYPSADSGCTTFGANDSLSLSSYGDGKTSANNGYVWNLWHQYECCHNEGIFLWSVP